MMDQPGMLWLWKALLPWLPSMGRTMRYSSATVITTFQLEIDIDRKCYTTTRLGASHACCTLPAAARRTGPTAMASTSPPGWSSNISFERNGYLAWNWMIHNFDFMLLMTMMILIWRVIERWNKSLITLIWDTGLYHRNIPMFLPFAMPITNQTQLMEMMFSMELRDTGLYYIHMTICLLSFSNADHELFTNGDDGTTCSAWS